MCFARLGKAAIEAGHDRSGTVALPRMWTSPRRIALPCLALLAVLAACKENRADTPALPPADATYTVRGKIQELPAGGGHGDLLIHHEAIDTFRDREGKEVGMKTMVMPFTPAADLEAEGLAPGDRVRFTFEVRWSADPMMRVTHLEKLPPNDRLDFEQ
jgi:hypothetical protein